MKRRFLADLEQFVRDLWRFKLTTGGKALVIAGIISGFLGHPLQLPILYTFSALFALGFLAWLVNLVMRGRIEVTGVFPATMSTGQPATGWFTLINRSRWPVYDVSAGFFGLDRGLKAGDNPVFQSRIEPGGRTAIPITLHPLRRGLYVLPPLRTYTTFPFSICRAGRKTPLGTSVLVAPHFHRLTSVDVPVGRRYQPGGIALTSDVGESPEYIGNREYRPGDPQRRIDFRSWARLGKPVVREYQEEFYCRIALVLDTYVPGLRRRPRAGFPELEAAVSLSASVADALSRGEYIIDIFAAGPELYVFRAGRHTAHFENILEILACVDACRKDPFEIVAPAMADELANISSVVCVFLDWDRSREGLVQIALEAGCDVKVVVVRDGPTTESLAQAEALTAAPVTQLSVRDIQEGGLDRL